MRLDAGRSKLYSSLKDLKSRWELVEPTWNDPIRHDFEERIFDPIVTMSEDALRAIDALAQVLTEMRNDCEGRAPFYM